MSDGAAFVLEVREWKNGKLHNSFSKLRLREWNHGDWSRKPAALKQAGLTLNDIDLIELNEALLQSVVQ
jgi:acetyl-CoA acetyltransferase